MSRRVRWPVGVCSIASDGRSPAWASYPPALQLTVRKILVHPYSQSFRRFNLQIDGVTVLANTNAGSTGPRTVTPGVHTVGETGGTGTSLGAFHTVIGADCAANGSVTLAPGDNKTCTITNFDNFGGCPAQSPRCCEPGTGEQGCRGVSEPLSSACDVGRIVRPCPGTRTQAA